MKTVEYLAGTRGAISISMTEYIRYKTICGKEIVKVVPFIHVPVVIDRILKAKGKILEQKTETNYAENQKK